MDAAIEQLIGYQGHTLQWNLPDDTNKLCHRCGKLGPLNLTLIRAHALARAHALKALTILNPLSASNLHLLSPKPPSPTVNDASEILSLLKALQQDMADVHDRITTLELNDRCMTRIEQHIGLQPMSPVPNTAQSSDMNINQPDVSNSSLAQDSLLNTPPSRPLNPLLPDLVPAISHVNSAHNPSSVAITPPATLPFPKNTSDEIQAINEKHSAIESKMDMLVASISGFIGSINTSPISSLANSVGSN
ncbi:hypothetical protein RCL_jg16081.t1 [Rhizophagus clarus]|uniref:Uncharacterized protein n=1 Tax=Rhizophagus clarus TaxID=94130 RepID=A0A8H3QLC9_9GLOM|nr:hypothetical protein RCL_jg16081.t1 [Rhizophagus clarus]